MDGDIAATGRTPPPPTAEHWYIENLRRVEGQEKADKERIYGVPPALCLVGLLVIFQIVDWLLLRF